MLALCQSAVADPPAVGDETIVIIDRAPDPEAAPDRDRALGEAPFVTVIHPHTEDHPATTSVADAVGATVGVQTRSLGGLGAYESISVRGAAPGHTAVLVDGVPLSRIAAVTTDLGRYALDAFGEVALYRGAVPVELGGAGVGGALNLVTRLGPGEHGERVHLLAGAGSFGATHLRAHYGDRHGHWLSSTTVGYQSARGDYSYYSDNGTPLTARDDTYLVRQNNGFHQLDAATRIGDEAQTTAGGVRFAYKQQGLPGSITQPALATSLSTLDVVGDARHTTDVGPATATQLGYVLVEQQRLRDPDAELGIGSQDRGYLTLSGGASSTWHLPIARHRAAAGVELRADRFRDADRTNMREPLVGDREGGALMASFDLVLDPDAAIVVTPALRWDLVRTSPAPMAVGPDALAPLPTRWDRVPSPRLSARGAVTTDLSIKASAGWYVRLPTLIELFGDRGTISGSPALRPERGPSADAGFVWAPAKALGDLDRIFVEASAFATRSHDTIAFVSSIGYIARALNIANTQSYGGELVASARIARTVSVTANYTRLVTQQLTEEASYANKALPRQPAHALYGRADVVRRVRGRTGSLWADASWQSQTYLDQANLMEVPARVLAGVGARVELVAQLAIALSIDNLTDERVQYLPLVPPPRPDLTRTPTALADVAGFPLPGRSFFVSLDWSH